MTADREELTWQLFGAAADELAGRVAADGFAPDLILAVARGGLFVAGALGYALSVKNVAVINVEFYTDVQETLPDPVLLAPMLDTESIRNKRILIVDDVVDSGRTLALVLELLRGFEADVRSAVLYAKPTTVINPDFVWKATDKWIVFPWSAKPPVGQR